MRIGYYADYSVPSQPVFRCEYCAYDGMVERNALQHVENRHSSIHRREYSPGPLRNWRVTLGLLTWNNRLTSMDTARALIQEASYIKQAGGYAQIVWVDNGSTDGTRTNIRGLLNENSTPYKISLNTSNRGQSEGRNKIIDAAVRNDSDVLLMLDGDIVPIPYSVCSMVKYMADRDPEVIGCIGMTPGNCTNDWADVLKCAYEIDDTVVQTDNKVLAWTQYGLFNMDPFKRGMRFDTADCFKGPGWGFEDNDLGLQLTQAGYSMPVTSMRYYHLRNSGLNALRELSLEHTSKVFEARRAYMTQKWGRIHGVHGGWMI